MSKTTPKEPREWKFKIIKEPMGFSIIWNMDFNRNMDPGPVHVIEHSAYVRE